MFLKCFDFSILTVYSLFLEGAACFFVKHVDTGMCINDTSEIQSSGKDWGNVSFVELSNNCLDPAAQFRFLDNGAMFNLKRNGCLAAYKKATNFGGNINMFYVYVSVNLYISACAQNDDDMIYRAITQTSWGGLSVSYRGSRETAFQPWCAVPKTFEPLAEHKGIDPCVGLTTSCDDAKDKRFNFGSVMCHGNMIKNANCPKNQYMVVKSASIRGLPATKTCGLSNDYICQVDVTCLVKKQCDGQHECTMTVDDSLFSVKLCEGLTRYLYFEYRCINNPKPSEICALLPDKPTNLTVTNITTRSAKLSWQYPENEGDKPVERFQIKWKNGNVLIVNTTEYKIDYLRPFTKYEISVAAGNENGFGEEAETSFLTSEEAPDGPPRNIAVTAESSSSFNVTWTPPVEGKKNGLIVNYTVCISLEENKPWIKKYNTPEQMLVISNLNDSTKYCVRVLASTKAGRGNYSECQDEITNGKAPAKGTDKTGSTLLFSLQIPSLNFTHFYVVALKLTDAKEPKSPQNYKNDELVTYFEAEKLTIPKPYIAAVFTSASFDGRWFVLGEESDNNVTINPTSRKRRSTTSGYHNHYAFNGPLDPGTRYKIFQRIFVDTDEYYSTDWSRASETNPAKTTRTGGPRVLVNMSSGDTIAREGDIVNLLCSAQGEPPITITWTKDQKPLSLRSQFIVTSNHHNHHSSLLVINLKDETNFGKYVCHIQGRFESTTRTIWVEKDTGCGKFLAGIIVLTILQIILLAGFAYFVYQNRLTCSTFHKNVEKKTKDDKTISNDIYDNPVQDDVNDYEQVENDDSTYTALKRTGEHGNDDHVYCHLNKVGQDVNQKETGI